MSWGFDCLWGKGKAPRLKWGALEMFINKRRYYIPVVYLRFDHLTNLS